MLSAGNQRWPPYHDIPFPNLLIVLGFGQLNAAQRAVAGEDLGIL